jgi:dTDP-4-dehydrorhamnose reductase
VRDDYFDQLKSSDHWSRSADLDLIAGLGIRTLRYPLLWELMAPQCHERIDWSWADDRLARLAALSIRPIVGLVHHGSGPRYTNLTEPGFATGLAHYAQEVARRFPWVQWYTPVNEPLTTARFSGLYGLWYPHGRDNRTFARALINQCRGTVLAMQAVRRVNSNAKLLQTEDLGSTTSTPRMQYQADFDNERRWVTWDLLCGTVSRDHPLYQFLIECGIDAAELRWFNDNPCPPDLVGINHYVTSDRFLDERCNRYPESSAGSNGRDRYADVEAVRVVPDFEPGWNSLSQQAWRRYQIPLVLSEVHLGCTREEQIRWFQQAWCASHQVRATGVDIRAVTAWALLGSYNWNTLLTTDDGHYEPGAFDVRAAPPRPTALARLLRGRAAGADARHPVLKSPGWWNRSERRLFAGDGALAQTRKPTWPDRREAARPILILGSDHPLSGAIAGACEARGLEYFGLGIEEVDMSDLEALVTALQRPSPWAVVNADCCAHVAGGQGNLDRCGKERDGSAQALALATSWCAIPLLTFSFQTVEAAAQIPALERNPRALCLLSAAASGARGRAGNSPPRVGALSVGKWLETALPDLINVGLDLLIDGECGLWQLSSSGAPSWVGPVSPGEELTKAEAAMKIEELQRKTGRGAAKGS